MLLPKIAATFILLVSISLWSPFASAGTDETIPEVLDWTAFPSPHQGPPKMFAPADPCLPPDIIDWRDLAQRRTGRSKDRYSAARIVIRRDTFQLVLEGVRSDGSTKKVYTSTVGLGDVHTPTPTGTFVLNHVYCYPDVLYYDGNESKVPDLYKGFLAPLMLCEENGRCERYRDLGIHGFDAQAHPNRSRVHAETVGPVSSGCIRVPDPCGLKAAIIGLAGVGPLRKNERGCYHWLQRPVEVWIVDDEVTLASLVADGLAKVGRGLKGLFDIFADSSSDSTVERP